MQNDRRVNSMGISLGGSSECIQVWVGETPLYIHGSYEKMRAFGREIIAAADKHEESGKREASNVA